MATSKRLKAWVRYDGQNKIVPSSLILQANKPKIGTWEEILTDLCCTTTTTTAYCLPCRRWKFIGEETAIQGTLCGGIFGCGDIDLVTNDEICLQGACNGDYPSGPNWVDLGPCNP